MAVIFCGIIIKTCELLDVDMKNGAHRCANDLRIVRIDAWRNDCKIVVIEGDSTTNNSAEVA